MKKIAFRRNKEKKDFISLWAMIKTNVELSDNINESHSFDEDFDYTNRKIAAFTFLESRYTVKTWLEMQKRVIGFLAELDLAGLMKILQDDKFPARFFSIAQKEGFDEIQTGLYVLTKTSTQTKLDIINRLFDKMGLDKSELSLEIYQESLGS